MLVLRTVHVAFHLESSEVAWNEMQSLLGEAAGPGTRAKEVNVLEPAEKMGKYDMKRFLGMMYRSPKVLSQPIALQIA